MLLDATDGGGSGTGRILVSNWSYDAVQAVGDEGLVRLTEGKGSTFLGGAPRAWHPLALAALLESDGIASLAEFGQQELFSLKLTTGRRRYTAIVSSGTPGRIDVGALRRLHMACCYVLCRFESEDPVNRDDPLSDRERECLFWVSEGKTAEEVALILNVSSNTVNSYVAHAIHKLAASNRAMAIATAIRRGLI